LAPASAVGQVLFVVHTPVTGAATEPVPSSPAPLHPLMSNIITAKNLTPIEVLTSSVNFIPSSL
jgi:hypothetical protein